MARDGFDVVVNTRSDVDQAEKVAAEAREFGVAAAVAAADVSDPAAVGRLFTVADGLGPLRVLVNNAAARTRVPVYDVTAADWEAVRAVTLDGAMNCVLAALPRLRTGGGSVVSIIGGNALRGDPGRFHVSAAKYGLIGMTKALAAACAADHVNVNAVSPSHMNPGDESRRGPRGATPSRGGGRRGGVPGRTGRTRRHRSADRGRCRAMKCQVTGCCHALSGEDGSLSRL